MAKVDTSRVAHLPLFAGIKPENLDEILREARSARDRTADTGHPEGEEHADRVRRRTHDVVDQIVGSEGHGQLRSEVTIAARG